ncbi:thymidine phosphorylase [Patescibacteria group bacterium]|nr:thymidine phosphorylase [Patescibacteria group bacterium]MBU4142329.1 thymidine phosphorylase [Patescibacteria group bacterium]
MPFFKAKKLDFSSGRRMEVVLREEEARRYGIRKADVLKIKWKKKSFFATVNYTNSKVEEGEIGFFREIWQSDKGKEMNSAGIVEVSLIKRPDSIKAIKKKLLGSPLNYKEIKSIIKDISDGFLGDIETTYFVASSFRGNFSDTELYYLTKAMVETGDQLKFKGMVVDKHSVGGLPGNRVTPILVPIIASLGFTIPKTSSRAVTSPAGTSDTLEVFMPVCLETKDIKKVVAQTGGCLVWGGALRIAPADDKIIKVSYPLVMEPYNKMIVSIMAKKVAMGIKYLVIDMPIGRNTKIKNKKAADMIERKMRYIAGKFGIKLKVMASRVIDPAGRGIGPSLEARDILRVLQQKKNRPMDLEKKALKITSALLVLTGKFTEIEAKKASRENLRSLKAWEKIKEIISAQGGNQNIDSEKIKLGSYRHEVKAAKNGRIAMYDNRAIIEFCRILGAPSIKQAGIYLDKVIGNKFKKGETLFTLYADSLDRLDLAKAALKKGNILKIV